MKIKDLSKSQLITAAVITGVLGTITIGASFAGTPATTYYISPSGNDANPGTTQTAPLQTIQKALSNARSGDTVLVNSGVYHTAVSVGPINNGVTLRGTGPTKPIIDGDNTRDTGISLVNGVHDVVVDNFEVRNTMAPAGGRAAGIVSYNTYNDTIMNNEVHDIHSAGKYSYGIVLGWNGNPGQVHNVTVKNNRIHDIGPGGESEGIWMLYTKDMTIDGNEIYLVRKEAIRDWVGLHNIFTNNHLYLNWIGMELQGSVGGIVTNNVSYNNSYAYNPKHVSSTQSLAAWGLTTGEWSKIWHNTAYASSHADVGLGMNPPNEDYMDVRDNIFASPSDVHLHDFPTVRGSHIIVDSNAYSGDAPMYYTSWNWPPPVRYNDLESLKAGVPGWETHGQNFVPQFLNPAVGDFRFDPTGLEPGVNLGDSYGDQVGARLSTQASNRWERYPTTVVSATEAYGPGIKPQYAGDNTDTKYWASKTNANASLVFDLGSPQQINTFILDVFGHMDTRTPKTMNIQVSNDNSSYSPALTITNPDSEGSSYKYSLGSPTTARYVRLNIVANFGGPITLFSDFKIGLLSPVSPTPTTNHAPAVTLASPASDSATEPATITLNAAASDPDGKVAKVEFFQGSTKLGESITAPYTYTWFGAKQGTYSLTARATDDQGAKTTSSPVSLKVDAPVTNPPAADCSLSGDITCDKKVDFHDLSALLIKVDSKDTKADVNKDGVVDFRDMSYLLSHFSK